MLLLLSSNGIISKCIIDCTYCPCCIEDFKHTLLAVYFHLLKSKGIRHTTEALKNQCFSTEVSNLSAGPEGRRATSKLVHAHAHKWGRAHCQGTRCPVHACANGPCTLCPVLAALFVHAQRNYTHPPGASGPICTPVHAQMGPWALA